MSISLFVKELDGKRIAYSSESIFEIQLSKGKSKYRTVNSFKGNEFGRALMHYNMLNIRAPFNKRLVCFSMNKPLLARHKGI